MKKIYLLFLLAFLPLLANADAVQIDGIYYNLNAENQVAQVTRNPNKYSGEITIPKSVTYEEVTYSVISIGESAFNYCNGVTSITIPNSVTSIENGAFQDCSGLTSITIPNSVTSIGYYVFNNCSGLASIVVEAGNTVYDSRDNCNAIIETASNTLIRGCKTTVFPNNVTSIGRYAFTGCSGMTSVTIPSSVTFIENSAFTYCSDLTSIVVEAENTEYDSRDNCNAIIRTASNYLVAGCKTTVIPDGVTRIAYDAFAGCSGLTSVEIPNSVTHLLGSTFRFCDGLTSVNIPNSVTYLGAETFYGCRNLASVTISNGVTSILVGVFHNCTALASVEIPNSVTSIDSYAFASCRSLTSVEIPNSVTSIGRGAFLRCYGLTSVTISNSVTSIGENAFQECKGLTSVTIPHSVTSIGESAFSRCSGLTSVTSLATTPPQAEDNTFTNYDIPLYVPKGTRDAYLAASPWNKFKEIIELENTDEDEITIKSYGKGTYCSRYDLDFSDTENLKAFIVSGYDHKTNTIWLTRVKSVPAGTGIIVKGIPGDYRVKHVESLSIYANFLVGTTEDKKIKDVEGEMTNFVLSKGEWYRFDGEITLPKGMAYLPLPLSKFAGTRSLIEVYEDNDEGTTEIRTIEQGTMSSEHDAWFNLQGQRVAKPGKGLYIHNGRKVVIK